MPQPTNLIVVVRTEVADSATAATKYQDIQDKLATIPDLHFSANVTEQLKQSLSPTPP